MGLDLVEFMMAIEDAFEIAIPTSDAPQLTTPAQLVDYICDRVEIGDDGPPLVQVAFYRIRRALIEELGVPRDVVHPETRIADLTDRDEFDVWRAVAIRLGIPAKILTHAPTPRWLTNFTPAPKRAVGVVARQLAMLRPAALKTSHCGWSRRDVSEVAVRLLEFEIGTAVRAGRMDATFVRDLGMG